MNHDNYAGDYLIVAVSGRALAQSARRAGMRVHVIDSYGDADTRDAALSVTVLRSDGRFNGAELKASIEAIVREYSPRAIITGSGFEAIPELLDEVATLCPLLGNSSAVVRALKDPASFFGMLDRLGIPYPQTAIHGPATDEGWLAKPIGGCGGTRIRGLRTGQRPPPDCYRQRRIHGRSYSVLFLADGRQARVLGYSEHWQAQPDTRVPYRHSAVLSVIPGRWQKAVERSVALIVKAGGLRGLCGLDFIVDRHEGIHVLEVNPRPPASFELHETGQSLFAAHLRACRGHLPLLGRPAATRVQALAVLYSPVTVFVPAGLRWPSWTADRPLPGQRIRAGWPLCTVFAAAGDAVHVRGAIRERFSGLLVRLLGKIPAKAIRIAASLGTGVRTMAARKRKVSKAGASKAKTSKVKASEAGRKKVAGVAVKRGGPPSVNALATPLVRALIRDAAALRLGVQRLPNGTVVVDAGINVLGGLEAGRRITEICMGGLGRVNIRSAKMFAHWIWHLDVSSTNPVLACLASQYAGWSLSHGEGRSAFNALGSGPARAMGSREELFKELGYRDSGSEAFMVIETDRVPPVEVAQKVADQCGIKASKLTLILTPTSSLAGAAQVVGRVLEVAMHKVHSVHFPLDQIVDGSASAPMCPPAPDFLNAMGRTNDAIIFGGQAHLFVSSGDAEAEDLARQLPSNGSRDFGKPFAEVFKDYQYDFYRVDPMLFSPARVIVTSVRTGRSFHGGALHEALLDKSFGIAA